MDKIAIVGAGFYGLMLGKMLSKKYKVDIFEEQNDIMTQASAQCQMRIHSGMMYPRDLKTAMMCVRTFKPFMLKFKDAIVDDFKSLYAVANDSKISSKEKSGKSFIFISLIISKSPRLCRLFSRDRPIRYSIER